MARPLRHLDLGEPMPATQFDRDAMAVWYATQHLKTDPGITSVHYLPRSADEREIRFVEVNKLMADRTDDALEPIDFGIDGETDHVHRLCVLDVTPEQWKRIMARQLALPGNWTLEDMKSFSE